MVEYLLKLFGSDMLRSGVWSSTLVMVLIFGPFSYSMVTLSKLETQAGSTISPPLDIFL